MGLFERLFGKKDVDQTGSINDFGHRCKDNYILHLLFKKK